MILDTRPQGLIVLPDYYQDSINTAGYLAGGYSQRKIVIPNEVLTGDYLCSYMHY
jgi:hypothetical protein